MRTAADNSPTAETSGILAGRRVAFIGRLCGMTKRDAHQLIRARGGVPCDAVDATVDMVVIGEESPPLDPSDDAYAWLEQERDPRHEVLRESELWQRLGLVEHDRDVRRLYTPAMLAELLHVPVAVVRRWHRRGLIVPAREVRKLPYFDFREVATARRLAELVAAGMSPQAIEKKLAALARWLGDIDRPLAQLSILVEGRELLLRQGDGLVEPSGQFRFDFEQAAVLDAPDEPTLPLARSPSESAVAPARPVHEASPPASHAALVAMAAELDDAGRLHEAAEAYRAALAAGGPHAETCFQLAELLYRTGDLAAARERYYMAIEINEDYVEARANLGCVLAESGQLELAAAAFEGALRFYDDYADARYHLARTLDELGRRDEAEAHWRRFLDTTPESPWAAEARARLGLAGDEPSGS